MKIKNLKQKLLITAGYLSLLAVFYFLDIGCVYKALLGIPCPGCGMTRAALSLLRFDFRAALNYHPMVFSLPILYLCFLFDGSLFKNKALNRTVITAVLLGFLVNWIIILLT